MAQNTFINVTADTSARPSPNEYTHIAKGGASASSHFTVSYDSAVITTLALYDTCAAAARQRAIGGGLK